jgi:hypothetical protein
MIQWQEGANEEMEEAGQLTNDKKDWGGMPNEEDYGWRSARMWQCNKLFQLLWSVGPEYKLLSTKHKQWSHHHCLCPPTKPVTRAEVGTGKDRSQDCHDLLFKALSQEAYSFPNSNPSVKCDHIETDHHVCTQLLQCWWLIHRQTYGVVMGSPASTWWTYRRKTKSHKSQTLLLVVLHEPDLHDLAETTQEGGTVVLPRSVYQTHNWPLRLNNTATLPS